MLRWYGADAYIDYLSIHEEWRGRGIGQHLMFKAEKELKNVGCRQIIVTTVAFQAPDFYLHVGYKQVATVPNYMDGHDQIIFRKILSGESVE